MNNVILIDDDPSYLEGVSNLSLDINKFKLYTLDTIPEIEEFRKIVAEKNINALVVDLRMKEKSGLEFLTKIRKDFPKMVFILLTGQLLSKEECDDVEKINAKIFYKSDGSINVLHNVIQAIDTKKSDDLSIQIPYDTYSSIQQTLRPMLLEYADEIENLYRVEKARILTSGDKASEEDKEKELQEILADFINLKPQALQFVKMRMKALEKIAKIKELHKD